MSANDAVKAILAAVEKRIARVAPFRATVDSLSAGKVLIQREGADTADTQAYARLAGFDLAVADEVLCVNLGKQALVLGKIQRAAPTGVALSTSLTFNTNTGTLSRGTSPTIAAGAGAGTGGSLAVAIEGTDRVGKVAITTGSSGVAAGILARITFNVAMADANFAVLLTAADTDAADEFGWVNYTTLTTTYWELSCRGTPANNTSHHWFYEVLPYEP